MSPPLSHSLSLSPSPPPPSLSPSSIMDYCVLFRACARMFYAVSTGRCGRSSFAACASTSPRLQSDIISIACTTHHTHTKHMSSTPPMSFAHMRISTHHFPALSLHPSYAQAPRHCSYLLHYSKPLPIRAQTTPQNIPLHPPALPQCHSSHVTPTPAAAKRSAAALPCRGSPLKTPLSRESCRTAPTSRADSVWDLGFRI
jgi:hypothetical protein